MYIETILLKKKVTIMWSYTPTFLFPINQFTSNNTGKEEISKCKTYRLMQIVGVRKRWKIQKKIPRYLHCK